MGCVRKIAEEFKSLREWLIPDVTFDEYKYDRVRTEIEAEKDCMLRRLYLEEAIRLLVDMELHNGTKEEIAKLTMYFWILMESYKNGLNFYKAREDLGITELKDKYGPESEVA